MITVLKKEWKHFVSMILILLLATAAGCVFTMFRVQETNIVLIYRYRLSYVMCRLRIRAEAHNEPLPLLHIILQQVT